MLDNIMNLIVIDNYFHD